MKMLSMGHYTLETWRLALSIGLVFQKLLWEVLKRKQVQAGTLRPSESIERWLVKLSRGMLMLFVLIQTLFLDLLPIATEAAPLRIVGTTIYAFGLGMSIIARLQLGKNWAGLEEYQILPGQMHVKTGLYRFVRHPIYAGDTLILLGLQLALNSWLVVGVCIVIFFVVKHTAKEEEMLSRAFPDYEAYRRETKKFIPFIV